MTLIFSSILLIINIYLVYVLSIKNCRYGLFYIGTILVSLSILGIIIPSLLWSIYGFESKYIWLKEITNYQILYGLLYYNIFYLILFISMIYYSSGRKKFLELFTYGFDEGLLEYSLPLTKVYIQLFNKYQTEEQDRLLYRDFQDGLKNATTKFVEAKLTTGGGVCDKLPLRSKGICEIFRLISLEKLI
ncbi:hypothetical protein HOK00_00435 [bacterium]|jgi:hypothetical protein|nr:hypothetical protein [bacterium]